MNKPKTVAFEAGERSIFYHILTACNLRCRHCYINPEQHGSNTLSIADIENGLKILRGAGPANVIFLGGEPTLHPDLPTAIRVAKKLDYAVTVDSNGYMLNNFLENIQPDEVDFLSFSLDGPNRAVNDPIRGEGSFTVCTGNLQKAVALGFNVSVIYTVSRANIADLADMIPLLTNLSVKRFFIQVIGLRGKSAPAAKNGGNFGNSPQVSRDEWLAVVPAVAARAAKAGIHVTYPKVFLETAEEFACAGLVAENFFVFPNGRVYRCPLCEDYPVNSYRIEGNSLVRETGLREEAFFALNIAEGCVMNKLLQPDTIEYDAGGAPPRRISCCLLKQEIRPE
ncbi:MAG TPA: radical SAM protein [Desulfobulbaceae bacterium]|nr:radical SAM protein [Desulfobulbaceae bacterium]